MIIILIIYSLSTSLIPSSKDSVEISISSNDSVITFEKPIDILVTVNNNSKKNKTIREFELPTINNYRIPWKLEIVFQNTDTVITFLNAYIYFSDKVEDEYIELKDKYSFSFTLNYNHIYFMIPDSNKINYEFKYGVYSLRLLYVDEYKMLNDCVKEKIISNPIYFNFLKE